MAKKTLAPSTKRFGTRYGSKNKEKLGKIEMDHRKRHKCPFCHYEKVERLAAGIWGCNKCNEKFTGKAYSFTAPKKIVAEEDE